LELFVFASFGKVHFSKFRNFLEITSFFELAKILQKKFRKKFGNNFLFLGHKTLFLSHKTLFLSQKNPVFWSKSLGKFRICSIPNFSEITKK